MLPFFSYHIKTLALSVNVYNDLKNICVCMILVKTLEPGPLFLIPIIVSKLDLSSVCHIFMNNQYLNRAIHTQKKMSFFKGFI